MVIYADEFETKEKILINYNTYIKTKMPKPHFIEI